MSRRTTIPRARDQERSSYQPVRREEEPAARQAADFVCPRGHAFTLAFADDVELPAVWECRQHSTEAKLKSEAHPQLSYHRSRCGTHWDMVQERRKEPERAQILADQLKALRAGQLESVEEWLERRRLEAKALASRG